MQLLPSPALAPYLECAGVSRATCAVDLRFGAKNGKIENGLPCVQVLHHSVPYTALGWEARGLWAGLEGIA